MASAFTWATLRAKIQRDLDLQDEIFITNTELLGYANEAIDEAEQEVLTIYEDYFLTNENLALVTGTAEYSGRAGISISHREGSRRVACWCRLRRERY